MACHLPVAADSRSNDDSPELLHGTIQFVIDNNIIEFGDMRDLVTSCPHAPGNDLVAVLATVFQAVLQRLQRRRQDEYADAIGKYAPHLCCALPVDFQQDVASVRGFRLYP